MIIESQVGHHARWAAGLTPPGGENLAQAKPPRLAEEMDILAADVSSRVSNDMAGTSRRLARDVKIEGTNSISPLASIKVSKNKPKTNWFFDAKYSQK